MSQIITDISSLQEELRFSPKKISNDSLTSDDMSILSELERKNHFDYNDSYVSEFLKCRQNPLYFIHNYCHIPEIGGSQLYKKEFMNKKYRRVIKSLNKYHKAILMASRQLNS